MKRMTSWCFAPLRLMKSMIERFHQVCPAAATFSKDPRAFGIDFPPILITAGRGTHVRGDDGKWYLDWISALGANLLGYSNRHFLSEVSRQLERGISFSLPHTYELELAEMLVDILGHRVPGWSSDALQVRFAKSGSDATSGAVRLARAVTGKSLILRCGYHGWHDWAISTEKPAWGIPQPACVRSFAFNTIPNAIEDLAAVILEQGLEEPNPTFYADLRQFCEARSALLILDEVVTGFRYALGGAAERYHVQPDLACYGKALANGFPLSALVGRRELMAWFARKDPVFMSSTFGGEAVSLAAALATLKELSTRPILEHIRGIGTQLMVGLEPLPGLRILGHPERSLCKFAYPALRAYFIREMAKRGIIMNRPNFPNAAHLPKDVERTIAAAAEVLAAAKAKGKAATQAETEGKEPWILFETR